MEQQVGTLHPYSLRLLRNDSSLCFSLPHRRKFIELHRYGHLWMKYINIRVVSYVGNYPGGWRGVLLRARTVAEGSGIEL
jgi:hypothetical protein